MRTCTRKLEFDAAHRVMKHESKCKNLHGHRYTVEVTCGIEHLDGLGRVIDFGVIKQVFGAWLDEALDHGCVLNKQDDELIRLCVAQGWKVLIMGDNPTAECMSELLHTKAVELLEPLGVQVTSIKLYETPNCWSVYP